MDTDKHGFKHKEITEKIIPRWLKAAMLDPSFQLRESVAIRG